ncbi:MAG TPA: hypothetical protein ACFYD3_11790 [Candidatus Hypogeohydataceae bacterium YC41]
MAKTWTHASFPLTVCLLTFPLLADPALAFWTDLTAEQIKQAIEYGRTHKEYDDEKFLKEWTVILQGSGESVVVYTKYNLLALAARGAAKDSRELRPEEIDAILSKAEGRLAFRASLYGSTADFAQSFHAVLLYDEHIIQPIYKENPLAEPYGWRPMAPPVFRALCSYEFPLKDINPNAAVTLLLINPRGGERQVNFDLSKMR